MPSSKVLSSQSHQYINTSLYTVSGSHRSVTFHATQIYCPHQCTIRSRCAGVCVQTLSATVTTEMCAIKFSSVFFVAILCKSVISMQISSPRTPRHIHLHIHRKTSAEDCGNSSSKFTDVLLHDPITRNQLLSPVVSWMPSDQYGSHHQQHVTVVPLGSRQPSILQPCTCANLNCGCCVYMNIPRLGYQRECRNRALI